MISKTCEVLKRCDHLQIRGNCDGCGNLVRELAAEGKKLAAEGKKLAAEKKKLKFVIGGWYRTRGMDEVVKMADYDAKQRQPWSSSSGDRWSEDGRYLTNGEDNRHDLVGRVNPPTEYKPTKKWLWERDDDIYGCVILTKTVLEHPPWGDESNWRKIEGSEVEE